MFGTLGLLGTTGLLGTLGLLGTMGLFGTFDLLGTLGLLGTLVTGGSGLVFCPLTTFFVFGLEPPKKPPKNDVFLLGTTLLFPTPRFTVLGARFPPPWFTILGAAATFPPKNLGLLPFINMLPFGNEIRELG